MSWRDQYNASLRRRESLQKRPEIQAVWAEIRAERERKDPPQGDVDARCMRIAAAMLEAGDPDARADESRGDPSRLPQQIRKHHARTETDLRRLEAAVGLHEPATEENTMTTETKPPDTEAVEAFALSDEELAELDPLVRAAYRMRVQNSDLPEEERLPSKALEWAEETAERARRLARYRKHEQNGEGSVASIAESLILESRGRESTLRSAESAVEKHRADRAEEGPTPAALSYL